MNRSRCLTLALRYVSVTAALTAIAVGVLALFTDFQPQWVVVLVLLAGSCGMLARERRSGR